MNTPVTAYVGLGSNLHGPADQVRRAMFELDGVSDTRVVARSSLYVNPPMSAGNQPDYINAVAELATCLDPVKLLGELQRIEDRHGRLRGPDRWGPRTLDLDLLIYGDEIRDGPELTLPHPGIAQRSFVLLPLLEIEPGLVVPGKGQVRELYERIRGEPIRKYEAGS